MESFGTLLGRVKWCLNSSEQFFVKYIFQHVGGCHYMRAKIDEVVAPLRRQIAHYKNLTLTINKSYYKCEMQVALTSFCYFACGSLVQNRFHSEAVRLPPSGVYNGSRPALQVSAESIAFPEKADRVRSET